MASAGNERGLQDDPQVLNRIGFKAKVNSSLQISTSQQALLRNESLEVRKYSVLTSLAKRFKLQPFIPNDSLASPSAKFQQISEERDELSRSVPSSTSETFQRSSGRLLSRKIDWGALKKICKKWIKNPLNMAFLLWIICVAVSGAILFLVMTGMLNKVLTKKSQTDAWFEVNNQLLNALFTLMCLYQHPKRFYHLVLLCRWSEKDISTLRKVYCKNGTYKPHEWAHMMVVVVLLHVNCFAQYALCGLNLGFKRSERPVAGVGISLSIAFAAPALAGVYSLVSPLGKEYKTDEEEQNQIPGTGSKRVSLEKKVLFASINEQSFVEDTPQWKGGLFDLSDNLSVAYLSLFCSFCIFGWNMEKLGFGNMYVLIITFILFCIAPFWIFNLAAMNIDDENVRRALGLMGILLCVFGLLYGGFWRIQMRKRFNLPPNKLCCGKPAVADCIQWLFCCWCSLAQEVRTADFYDIVDENFFCKKQNNGFVEPALNSLPHEDRATQFRSMSSSTLWSCPRLSKIWSERSPSSRESKHIMEPPSPVTIDIEDNGTKRT